MKRVLTLALTLGLLTGRAAWAESNPRPVAADQRIRTVTFQKDNVVFLTGTMGISTMIVFGEEEHIATIALGDSQSWQAVPDQSKRYLFIKPLERDAVTNMNVVTSKRIYNFVLRGSAPGSARAVYKLRFAYPDEESDQRLLGKAKALVANPNLAQLMAHPELINDQYGYKGEVTNKPVRVLDDGVKTFFQFAGDTPAIFLVKIDRSETLVNYRREGDVIVVDKVAAQWTLRNGDQTTCVFNLRAQPEPPRTNVMTPVDATSAPVDATATPSINESVKGAAANG